MWGKQNYRDFNELKKPIREMAVSTSGNKIVYNLGNKKVNPDKFQVSLIEEVNNEKRAYSMGDADYFNIIKKYYKGVNIKVIDQAIKTFVKFIDKAAGFYDTYGSSEIGKDYSGKFDIYSENTFGYQNQDIIEKIKKFQEWYLSQEISDENSELEEALIIIFLAMISEWYYLGKYNNKSKWQHRVKLFGIYQVETGELSPEEAAQWSKKSENTSKFGDLCRSMKIFDKEFYLKK